MNLEMKIKKHNNNPYATASHNLTILDPSYKMI